MARKLMSAAAMALAAAALLAACDKTQPPAATAEVVQNTPKTEEPAATAQPELAPSAVMQQVRVPHMSQPGEEGLSSLKAMEGKYRWDGADYLKEGVLAQRLKALVGKHYETVLKNLETVGPLETEGNVMALFGNRQHQGGEESAAIVIDPERNAMRVWLLSDGQQTVFTDVQGDEIPWPTSIQTLIKNQDGLPAS